MERQSEMETTTSKCARRYNREFKQNAVALVTAGRTSAEVASILGVSHWLLTRWLNLSRSGEEHVQVSMLAAESSEQREVHRLRQGNDYLRRQRDIFKKSLGHCIGRDARRRFELIEMMRSEHPVTEMADALGLSASDYAGHRQKDQRPRLQEDRRSVAEVVPIFEQSRCTYGSPRLHDALRKRGYRCVKNRVARLQNSLGLRPRQKQPVAGRQQPRSRSAWR